MPKLDSKKRGRLEAAHKLLTESGWSQESLFLPKPGDDGPLRAEIASEPKLVIWAEESIPSSGLASKAYSAESEFHIQWGSSDLKLLRTNWWEDKPGDSPVMFGEADDPWLQSDIFDLMTPESLVGSHLTPVNTSGQRHESLAATLGSALANLRIGVANYFPNYQDTMDGELLRYFHQLLFVRITEDRGMAVGELRIADIATEGPAEIVRRLDEVLSDYQSSFNSELFTKPDVKLAEIGGDLLRPVIKALVEPWTELRIDFSLARADLAGRLYQRYLRENPAEEIGREQGSLFPSYRKENLQQQTAAFYTPMSVASVLAQRTVGAWLQQNNPCSPEEIRVVDPACGSGAFLIAAFHLIRDHLESRHGRTLNAPEREAILRQSIFGADIDRKAISITQIQLLEVADLPRQKLPELSENLWHGDSLAAPPEWGSSGSDLEVPWSEIVRDRPFDVLIANPPFHAQAQFVQRTTEEFRAGLEDRFPGISDAGMNVAYYFVPLAFQLTTVESNIGLIMPRTLLDGDGSTKLRSFVQGIGVPSGITDFRGAHLFPEVFPYVSFVEFWRSEHPTVDLEYPIRGEMDRDLLMERLVQQRLPFQTFSLERSVLSETVKEGWSPFYLRWRQNQHEWIGAATETMGESDIVEVFHGTQTGDQKTFIFPESEWKLAANGQVEMRGVQVPERFVPPVAWASKITPAIEPAETSRLFVTYAPHDGKVPGSVKKLERLLNAEVRSRHPGRLDLLWGPKVILSMFAREPSAFADLDGKWITVKGRVGGLCVAADIENLDEPSSVKAVCALLTSSLYQWLLQGFGHPKKDDRIQLGMRIVEKLPWPTAFHQDDWMDLAKAYDAIQDALTADSDFDRSEKYRLARSELDELVLTLFDASERLTEAIDQELIRYT